MTFPRRAFLATGAALAAGVSLPPHRQVAEAARPRKGAGAPTSGPQAELKLSSQLSVIPDANDKEKIARMVTWGFDGVELPGNIAGRVAEFKELIRGTSLKYNAVCWDSINGDVGLPSRAVEKGDNLRLP